MLDVLYILFWILVALACVSAIAVIVTICVREYREKGYFIWANLVLAILSVIINIVLFIYKSLGGK